MNLLPKFIKKNWNSKIYDSIFLSLIVISSLFLYIGKLGFYSDDWAFLSNFSLSSNQSILGLFEAFTSPQNQMRPIQGMYASVLYWLFGFSPLGYHILNAIVLISICIMFYLILRKIDFPRILSITVPLVYILVPHYATNRFWFAAFQVNISILFYFFSLYAGLQVVLSHEKNKKWFILSLLSLVISALSYEVVLPLFLFNILLVWNPGAKLYKAKMKEYMHKNVRLLSIFIVIISILIFKVILTTRLSSSPLQHISFEYISYLIHILTSAFKVNYIELLLNMPQMLWNILYTYHNFTIILSGLVFGLVIFWYLYSIASKENIELPNDQYLLKLTFLSFIIFILGYAIFFISSDVVFSSTGIGNRIASASAIGLAITIIATVGWFCRILFSEQISKFVFCILIALFCASCFVIINTLSLFWIKAYDQEQLVLNSIRKHVPRIPSNSSVLLDGICPFVGPAVVFESSWDLTGALQILYKDKTIRADIVKPNIVVEKGGIHTKIYNQQQWYVYDRLFIYNVTDNVLYPLTSYEDAQLYFTNWKNNCPPSRDGYGVTVFN